MNYFFYAAAIGATLAVFGERKFIDRLGALLFVMVFIFIAKILEIHF